MTALYPHHADYVPEKLLNALIAQFNIKSHASLGHILGVARRVISKIWHRRLSVGAQVLIAMREESELSIEKLRLLMGDRRDHFCSISGPAQGRKMTV